MPLLEEVYWEKKGKMCPPMPAQRRPGRGRAQGTNPAGALLGPNGALLTPVHTQWSRPSWDTGRPGQLDTRPEWALGAVSSK